jgi:hypothetical protein
VEVLQQVVEDTAEPGTLGQGIPEQMEDRVQQIRAAAVAVVEKVIRTRVVMAVMVDLAW